MKVTLADWQPTRRQIKLVNKVLKTGRLTYGPMTRKFEKEFARLHGFKYAIFTNSGTSALQVSLHYLKDKYGWKDGDEVIIPAVTFVATLNVVLHNRLKPVLVDVYSDTFNIDPSLIEKKITKRTRAIMPVDLLGQPCEIKAIRDIAKKHNLKIVEDSCETMFVRYKGLPVGSRADIACYSSYLAHIISTGVGGLICTNDSEAEKVMRSMVWHGRDNLYLAMDDGKNVPLEKLIHARFKFNRVGYSYRLTELEAALGLDELRRYKSIIKKRQWLANYLTTKLSVLRPYEYIQLPVVREGAEHAWMFYPILLEAWVNRDEFALYLEKRGIQTRWIMPLTNQPAYPWIKDVDYPSADYINQQGLLIGCHHFLTKKHMDYIAKVIKEHFNVKT